jgi:hypothetical protein
MTTSRGWLRSGRWATGTVRCGGSWSGPDLTRGTRGRTTDRETSGIKALGPTVSAHCFSSFRPDSREHVHIRSTVPGWPCSASALGVIWPAGRLARRIPPRPMSARASVATFSRVGWEEVHRWIALSVRSDHGQRERFAGELARGGWQVSADFHATGSGQRVR